LQKNSFMMNKKKCGKTDSNEHVKFIDIENVISQKSQRLNRLMPRFVKRYLKRILHEDSLNEFLNEQKNIFGIEFTQAALKHFGTKLIIHGLNNVSSDQRLLFAANHPLGGLDGIALMRSVGVKFPNFVFPVNDVLLHLPNLKDFFIPINKHGSNPKEAVRMLEDMMRSDKTVLFFPAGLVSRKKKGIIKDLEWKKTFVSKAKKHKRKIVPVYIDGHNSNFFYNLANLRKLFRIKANIEMLYLVDEMYKQYNKEINLYIGSPLSMDDFNHDMTDAQIAQHIKGIVYSLPHSIQYSKENELIVE
jgi:putative hemolysin